RLMPRSFESPSGTNHAPQLRQTVTPPARGLSITGWSQFGQGASVCPSISPPFLSPDTGQALRARAAAVSTRLRAVLEASSGCKKRSARFPVAAPAACGVHVCPRARASSNNRPVVESSVHPHPHQKSHERSERYRTGVFHGQTCPPVANIARRRSRLLEAAGPQQPVNPGG